MAIKTVLRTLSERKVRKSLFSILGKNVLCSMATVTKSGIAHINTAYFAYSKEPEIFFCSYPDSMHCKNLARNSSMAMTIFESRQVWGKPDTGVQLFGSCWEAKGRWTRKAESVYSKRFKGFAKWKSQMIKEEEGNFPLRFYRFIPTKAKILDEKEFGDGIFILVSPVN